MSKNEVKSLRDPNLRKKDFNNPVGIVNEQELKQIVGAGDITPQTTDALSAVIVSVLPTLKCSSQCRTDL